MIANPHIPVRGPRHPIEAGFRALLRAAALLVAALVILLAVPMATAADGSGELRLRGDITVEADVVTIGDLLAGAPSDVADIAAFRAPSLGETGTIQTSRILAAAEQLGLPIPKTFGSNQISVTRAARVINAAEIAAALADAVARHIAIQAEALDIRFEGNPPALRVSPHITGVVEVSDLRFDPASMRVAALVHVGGAHSGDSRVTVSARVVETVEIAVLSRPVARGEAIRPGDYAIERRPLANVPADTRFAEIDLDERVARRNLAAGTALRNGDLVRKDLVARGENVMIIYRSRNLTLTMRGTANEAGARGDNIAVTNPHSKRVLQAVVTGPGQVTVDAPSLGPVATTSRVIQ
ncbi:MAG: flagellar basal body P-ring formation chaperone FlgA [Salinarimonas sp.]